MRSTLRTADVTDLGMVWTALRGAPAFAEREEFERFFREAPWRVQVSDNGEAAVLERWRAHLDVLSVRGLWCAERRISPIMRSLDVIASTQGFADLISPVVFEGYADPYLDAGMVVCQRIVTMRLARAREYAFLPEPPAGVTLRLASAVDLASLLAVDIESFEEFWRADADTMARYLSDGRVGVAESDGRVIGYTLATTDRGDGILGRLAVIPGRRGEGIGTALLCDAIAYLARTGVSAVSLCTQETNAVSRSLYARAGFMEMDGTSVFLSFGRTRETGPIAVAGR